MGKFVILFAFLAIVHASSALTCKKCVGSDPACTKTEDDHCEKSSANTTPVCIWKVIKDGSNKETVTKMCGQRPNSVPKYQCAENKASIVKCDSCETDYCNSASAIGINVVAISLVALFASKFL